MKIEIDENGIMYGVYPKSSDQGFIDYTEKIKELDLEQRRYEIAKEALTAIMSNNDFYSLVLDVSREKGNRDITKSVSEAAVSFADALIEELKKKRK